VYVFQTLNALMMQIALKGIIAKMVSVLKMTYVPSLRIVLPKNTALMGNALIALKMQIVPLVISVIMEFALKMQEEEVVVENQTASTIAIALLISTVRMGFASMMTVAVMVEILEVVTLQKMIITGYQRNVF